MLRCTIWHIWDKDPLEPNAWWARQTPNGSVVIRKVNVVVEVGVNTSIRFAVIICTNINLIFALDLGGLFLMATAYCHFGCDSHSERCAALHLIELHCPRQFAVRFAQSNSEWSAPIECRVYFVQEVGQFVFHILNKQVAHELHRKQCTRKLYEQIA